MFLKLVFDLAPTIFIFFKNIPPETYPWFFFRWAPQNFATLSEKHCCLILAAAMDVPKEKILPAGVHIYYQKAVLHPFTVPWFRIARRHLAEPYLLRNKTI